jgi:hypothetical protein
MSGVVRRKVAEAQLSGNERNSKRVEVRQGEGVSIAIVTEGNSANTVIACRVFDISSWGARVSIDHEALNRFEVSSLINRELTLQIALSPGQSYVQKVTVAQVSEQTKRIYIGFKFIYETPTQIASHDTREQPTLTLDKHFPLGGFLYKELYYKEKALIRVASIAKHKWIVTIYDTEVVLLKGMLLQLFLFLPHKHDLFFYAKVLNVLEDSYESMSVEVEIQDLPKRLSVHLCNYLVKMCDVSPEKLKFVGLEMANITDNYKFRYVRGEDEYEEVLRLRFEAYKNAGKVKEGGTFLDMISPLDKLSRILTVYHGNLLVASITLTFPDSDDLLLDTEKNLKSGYPKNFPPKTQMMEIARLCIREGYKKSNLVVRIFQHVYRIFGTSNRRFIVTSSDDKLWPIYKSIGMRKTGLSYDHPVFKGLIHHLITMPLESIIYSQGIPPLRWNYLYRDMTDYLAQKGQIKARGMRALKLWLWRRVGDITAPLWRDN